MTDSTASELVYKLKQSKKELEKAQPSVEESLAKFTALFEIQTMLKVADELKATAKDSVNELFKRRTWDVANGMTSKAMDKMNEILEQEENHDKED